MVAPVQVPPDWQVPPGQHAPPVAPQFIQVLGMPLPGFAQPSPLLQTSPEQQTSPLAPQGSQLIPPSLR
jgi:hypothetical protein